MSDPFHLMVAGFVFLMLIIGLVLTILEFSRGEPPEQVADDEYDPHARDPQSQAQARN